MTTLYISDLDGTLLGADSKVSAESASIITELSERGVLISVATARTPATVVPLLEDTFTSIPAIVLTGAAMWDRQANRFINPHLMPEESVALLQREFLTHDINPFIYTMKSASHLTVYHNGDMIPTEEHFYAERRNLELKKFIFGQPDIYTSPLPDCILFLGMGPNEKIAALADALGKHPELSVSSYGDIFNHHISYIEVFDAGVSKAHAVKRLAEMIGAGHIVAYGDNLNDLPMFGVADEAVAVDNAVKAVREAADRVIGRNTDSSVAKDILRLNS